MNIEKIIDHEIYQLRNIGCVVNIIDEENNEEGEEKYCND
jgi:hypothetical protein